MLRLGLPRVQGLARFPEPLHGVNGGSIACSLPMASGDQLRLKSPGERSIFAASLVWCRWLRKSLVGMGEPWFWAGSANRRLWIADPDIFTFRFSILVHKGESRGSALAFADASSVL